MDTPVIGAQMPQVDLVVNQSYAKNPFLAGAVRAAGYISNVEGAGVVEKVVERLRAGRSVVIFPEGTRSPKEGLGKFYRGAAHAALRSGCDLVPVVITVEPRKLMKGQKWYDLPEQPIEMDVRVLEPISPSKSLTGSEPVGMAARRVTAALREGYERELNAGE